MENVNIKTNISIILLTFTLMVWSQNGSKDKFGVTILPTMCDSTDVQDLMRNSPVPKEKPIYGVDGDAMSFISFPGGDEGLVSFIKKNLKYPAKAVKDSLQGKVIAKFNTDKDGVVCKVRIVQSLSKETDNEVIRVLSLLPNWNWSEKLKVDKRKELEWTIPVIFRFNQPKKKN
jgi:Gram-negative bacterial TonB protein C-terminal